jgi:hypothetical protein
MNAPGKGDEGEHRRFSADYLVPETGVGRFNVEDLADYQAKA